MQNIALKLNYTYSISKNIYLWTKTILYSNKSKWNLSIQYQKQPTNLQKRALNFTKSWQWFPSAYQQSLTIYRRSVEMIIFQRWAMFRNNRRTLTPALIPFFLKFSRLLYVSRIISWVLFFVQPIHSILGSFLFPKMRDCSGNQNYRQSNRISRWRVFAVERKSDRGPAELIVVCPLFFYVFVVKFLFFGFLILETFLFDLEIVYNTDFVDIRHKRQFFYWRILFRSFVCCERIFVVMNVNLILWL